MSWGRDLDAERKAHLELSHDEVIAQQGGRKRLDLNQPATDSRIIGTLSLHRSNHVTEQIPVFEYETIADPLADTQPISANAETVKLTGAEADVVTLRQVLNDLVDATTALLRETEGGGKPCAGIHVGNACRAIAAAKKELES